MSMELRNASGNPINGMNGKLHLFLRREAKKVLNSCCSYSISGEGSGERSAFYLAPAAHHCYLSSKTSSIFPFSALDMHSTATSVRSSRRKRQKKQRQGSA